MDGLGSFFTDFKALIMIYDYFLLNCNLDRTGTFLTCNLSMVDVEIRLQLTFKSGMVSLLKNEHILPLTA